MIYQIQGVDSGIAFVVCYCVNLALTLNDIVSAHAILPAGSHSEPS